MNTPNHNCSRNALERASMRLGRPREESGDVRADSFDLLDEIGAIDILRLFAAVGQMGGDASVRRFF